MHFVTNYTFKPHMTKPEIGQLMETFGAVGEAPGSIAHYVWADGRGGTVVTEGDDAAGTYRNILNFTPWIEFDVKVVLPVDDAVPQVVDFLG